MELDYYRLQKISEGSISLAEGYAKPLDGPCEVGSGMVREDPIALSRLIDLINERFGSELSKSGSALFRSDRGGCQPERNPAQGRRGKLSTSSSSFSVSV